MLVCPLKNTGPMKKVSKKCWHFPFLTVIDHRTWSHGDNYLDTGRNLWIDCSFDCCIRYDRSHDFFNHRNVSGTNMILFPPSMEKRTASTIPSLQRLACKAAAQYIRTLQAEKAAVIKPIEEKHERERVTRFFLFKRMESMVELQRSLEKHRLEQQFLQTETEKYDKEIKSRYDFIMRITTNNNDFKMCESLDCLKVYSKGDGDICRVCICECKWRRLFD